MKRSSLWAFLPSTPIRWIKLKVLFATLHAMPLTEVFNNLGIHYRRRGQKRARTYFEKSVQTDPSDPDYHFNLAVELSRRRRPVSRSRTEDGCPSGRFGSQDFPGYRYFWSRYNAYRWNGSSATMTSQASVRYRLRSPMRRSPSP